MRTKYSPNSVNTPNIHARLINITLFCDFLYEEITSFLCDNHLSEIINFSSRLTSVCNEPLSLIAAYCGCVLVKKCANRAYKLYGRAMLASDMVKEIPAVISDMFDECTVAVD